MQQWILTDGLSCLENFLPKRVEKTYSEIRLRRDQDLPGMRKFQLTNADTARHPVYPVVRLALSSAIQKATS